MSQSPTPALQGSFNAAMQIGVKKKDMGLIKAALADGADPNVLMFTGIEKKDLTLITLAVESGADVNAIGPNGKSPAIFYVHGNFKPEIAEYFLSKGVPVDVKDADGNTPLMCAASYFKNREIFPSTYGEWNKIEFYANHGADPTIPCKDGEIPLDKILPHAKSDKRAQILKKLLENAKQADPRVSLPDPDMALKHDLPTHKPLSFKIPVPNP